MSDVSHTKDNQDFSRSTASDSRKGDVSRTSWHQAGGFAEAGSHQRSWIHARPMDISVAVDPVALITTECISVTSAMRKHARWAHSSVSAILGGGALSTQSFESQQSDPAGRLAIREEQWNRQSTGHKSRAGGDTDLASRWGLRGKKGKSMQDNPLISAFARLRADIAFCTGMASFHKSVSVQVN